MNQFRSFLYLLAKLLGDFNAIRRGKIHQRIARRVAGKMTGRVFSKFFK